MCVCVCVRVEGGGGHDTVTQRRDIGCDESSVCNSLRWYAAMRCDRLAMSCGRPDGPAVLCHARLHSRALSALSYRPRTGSSYCLRGSLSSCNLSLFFFPHLLPPLESNLHRPRRNLPRISALLPSTRGKLYTKIADPRLDRG